MFLHLQETSPQQTRHSNCLLHCLSSLFRCGFRTAEQSGVARRRSTPVPTHRDFATTSSVRRCRSSTPDCARLHPRAAVTTINCPATRRLRPRGSVPPTTVVFWPPGRTQRQQHTGCRRPAFRTCSVPRWQPVCLLPDTTNVSGSVQRQRSRPAAQ